MTFILMFKSNPRFVSLIKHYLFFVLIYHPCDRSLLRCHVLSTHSLFNEVMGQMQNVLFLVSIHIHFLSLHESKFSFMHVSSFTLGNFPFIFRIPAYSFMFRLLYSCFRSFSHLFNHNHPFTWQVINVIVKYLT